jgi:excisionase family DNA binding protein
MNNDLLAGGLLTVNAAAAFLGIGRVKLYALMADGRVPYTMIDSRRLIPKQALIDLARERLVVNGQSPLPAAA